MEGEGRKIFQDGSYYQGHLLRHQLHDQQGVLVTDQLSIKGEFKCDQPTGQAQVSYHLSGNTYLGTLKAAKRHGYGHFLWNNNNKYKSKNKQIYAEEYKGDWKEDLREGKGCQIWQDGRTYRGDWKNDQMEGKGQFSWVNGVTYKGHYKGDEREGKGVVTWPTQEGWLRWQGCFQQGRQQGWAKVTT